MELESESQLKSGCVQNSGHCKGLSVFRLLGDQQPFGDKKVTAQNNSDILVMYNGT